MDKISTVDRVYLAEIPELFNGKGWHGKGTPLKIFNEKELASVLFVHEYGEAGVMTPNGFVKTNQKYALHPDGKPIGNAVGEGWNTPTNAELFEIFKSALSGSQYKITSCGTLNNRAQFFIDAKGENVTAARRDWAPFAGCIRDFGGVGSLIHTGHSLAIQCFNTSTYAMRESEKRNDVVKTKNSKFVLERMEWFKREIERIHGVSAEFFRAMNEAANEEIKAEDASNAFVGLISNNNKLTRRTVNRANRLMDLFAVGAGNAGQDLSDWYSSVTDYYSHESAGSIDDNASADEIESFKDKQWYSSERGSGAQLKANVTSRLFKNGEVNMEAFKNWRDNGREIVKNSDKDLAKDLIFA